MRARFAIAIPDGYDEIAASGSGTASYSQAGPGPGLCEPRDAAGRFAVALAGAQTRDLSVTVIRPGYVRQSDGLAVAYDTAADGLYRGWSPPNLIAGWTSDPTSWSATGGITLVANESAIAVNPTTGRVVVVGGEAGVTAPRTMRYDPRAETWDTGFLWSSALPTPCTMAYDPDTIGRLLLWGSDEVSYFSDDDGDTWQLHAVGGWDAAAADPRVAPAPGGLWLATAADALWTSTDRGVTWAQAEDLSTLGSDFVPLRTREGWLVVYISAASDVCARVLPYSRPVFSEAAEIVLAAGTYTQVDACADYDGKVWVVAATSSPARNHQVFQSSDGGRTWADQLWGLLGGGGGDSGIGAHRIAASCGSLFLLAATNTAGGTQPTTKRMQLLRLGGWGSTESGSLGTSARRRHGYGQAPSGGAMLGCWFPVDVPEDTVFTAWTLVGGGGTWTFGDFGDLGGELAANAEHRYRGASAFGAFDCQAGEAELRVVGPNVGTIGSPLSRCSIVAEQADGAYRYRAGIRVGEDGIRVVDIGGNVSRGLATIDATQLTRVRWHLTLGSVSVWYRQTADAKWTEICLDAAVTDEGASAVTEDRLTWGLDATGTQLTAAYFHFVGGASGGAWHAGIDGIGELSDTSADRTLGLRYGRPLTPGVYPIPDAAPNDGPLTWVSGTGGPGYASETVDVPVVYASGVDRLDVRLSPSPRAVWESTDGEVEQVIEWSATANRYRGGALALIAAGLRARTVTFERFDGTSWQSLGSIAGGQSTYTRSGRTIRPDDSALTGHLDRYLFEGELVGGWVRLEDGAGSGDHYYAPIVAQSAGFWSDAAGLQQATITVDLPDGYTGTAGGVGIFHHSAVLLADLGAVDVSRLRARLSVFAVENTVTHAAGVLTPCRVVGYSAPTGWSWQKRLELQRALSESDDGVITTATLGPPRRTWVAGWAEDGVAVGQLRDGSEPTTIGAGAGQVGSAEDPWSIWGVVEHAALSGEVPVVAIAEPAIGTTSDPTLFLWGRITSESFGANGVIGTEGTNELVRVDGPTVTEIR